MSFDQRLVDSIKKNEGFSPEVYEDTRGIPTIGYGTRIDEIELSPSTAEEWLLRELREKEERLFGVQGYEDLGEVRKAVILEMSYWMGVGGCLRFKRTWGYIRRGDWTMAAAEMRDSRTWRNERLRPRMERLATRMESGTW